MEFAKELIGQSVSGIGRTVQMVCISIGEVVEEKGIKECELTKYDIHCECAWRLLDSTNRIIVASNDVYCPPSNVEWSESFRWNVEGGNLFDEKIAEFNESHRNYHVTDVEITKCHDLIVKFDNLVTFEAFVDSSVDDNWRIIRRGSDPVHLVCAGGQLRTVQLDPYDVDFWDC